MQQIDIDFQVFKALTSLRRSESHTYNEVIRELLDIDQGEVAYSGSGLVKGVSGLSTALSQLIGPAEGFSSRGRFLPNGTLLRATYKGASYVAKISDGSWVNFDGESFGSPSAAAAAITGNNVNGWRFWQAKRPSDVGWHSLDSLPTVSR